MEEKEKFLPSWKEKSLAVLVTLASLGLAIPVMALVYWGYCQEKKDKTRWVL